MRDINDLELKVLDAKQRIKTFLNEYGDKTYLSFSGGKDSTVVAHLIKEVIKENNLDGIPFVFCNTGLELPYTIEFIKEYEYDNIVIISPKMKFSDVFKKYGRPVVSKDKDSKIQTYQNFRKKGYTKEEATNPNICVRGGQLVGNNLKPTIMGKLSKKDLWTLDTDIKISSMCCDKLKKLPFKVYTKQSGRDCRITGVRTQESLLRRLQNKSCFKQVGDYFQLTPIYDWKDDDVDLYIKQHNIVISRCYTEMGMDRTGCHLCPYNRNLFNDLNIIREHHPKLHKFIWEIMGDIYTEKRKNNEKK